MQNIQKLLTGKCLNIIIQKFNRLTHFLNIHVLDRETIYDFILTIETMDDADDGAVFTCQYLVCMTSGQCSVECYIV